MKNKKANFQGIGFLALTAALLAANSTQVHAEEAEQYDADGMGVLVVTGTNEESAILPSDTDAFGLGMSQVETPRGTSTVSLAMIDQYSLTTVRDLIAVTPGVFTASFYGVDGTVNIRGEYADNFFRGFKRVENQGTYITPIESALDLEIVRGAASPAYGTGRAGGYVNFTPRSERATRFMEGMDAKGEVVASLGTYNYYRASAEYGAPIKLGEYNAGVDVYVEKAQASQYFYGIEPRHTLVQGAFATELPGGWEFQAGVQYYDASGMQGSTGINRLTQDLIDNGTYVSGGMIAQLAQPGAAFITPDDIVNAGGVTKYFGASSDYSTLDPETMEVVQLDRRAMLSTPYDLGDSETTTAWFDLSRDIGNGTLKLQGFLDDMNADSYNGYGFAKTLRDQAQELRLSYAGSVTPASWLDAKFVVGAGYRRYDADEGYNFARGYMVLDRQDISKPATADAIFNPVFETGGDFDQFYHSTVDEYAGFLNTDIALFDQLKFTAGVRYDWYDVQASNTGYIDYSVATDTVYKNSKGEWSWSGSVRYVTPWGLVPYFTRSRSYALETQQGGAIAPGNVANDTFLSPSDLTEGGIKGSFFDDKLFASLSIYHQKRTQSELLSGNFVGATTDGVEAELRWAISQNFGVSAVYTNQKTEISGSSFLVVTPVTFGLDYTDGWGYIYQAATSGFEGLEDGYTDRTQPRNVFGLFANYEMGNGFGATLGGNYVDETSGQLPGAITYPDYMLLRGSVHYEVGRYRFAVNVNNITDERYYIPQRSTDTEGSAFPGEGRTVVLKVTARF